MGGKPQNAGSIGDVEKVAKVFIIRNELIPLSVSCLSGLHGGAWLQKHAQPHHVRQRAVIDAERVRPELRQAANESGNTDQPRAQG